ncbi:MAG: type II secretion system protein GspL [Candidatus Contendobacter odensis]|uniref:Type II secretion system protein L n=1 Tax=Candidatus Contendibacter odensensis TaxID=1400860 RepID=A0A2G6PFX4_9GAMM|nr:MAG: type II secretion system protein GspL [Candidatus Contendobacter odensis]
MVSVSYGAVLVTRTDTTLPASRLFFRFLSTEHAEWLRPDEAVQHGSLAELSTQMHDTRSVLIVPGESINLHYTPLPGRKRAIWPRAIPYMLEDQLVEDVENLHFALGSVPEHDHLPVAVVAHTTLRNWLHTCERAGITPSVVIPDILLIPWTENGWSILQEGERAIVRTGRWEGFVTEHDTFTMMLDLAKAGQDSPQHLHIWNRSGTVPLLAESQPDISIEHHNAESLALFAANYQPAKTLNLLQGLYARQTPWQRWLRPWRTAAALAGLWLFAQGTVQLYEQWQLRQEQVAIKNTMEQLFRQAVPDATRIVNPKVQMATRLRELQSSDTTDGALFELLYLGGLTLRQFSTITLRGFSYRDGQLIFDLQGGSPAVLDQLQHALNQQSKLQAEIRTLQRDGRLESKITLRRTAL